MHLQGFITFIKDKAVLGLAIGVLMGGAVSKLVTALVEDLINPILGLLLGRFGDLSKATLTVGTAVFKWGDLVSVLIDFVVIAAVVYVAVTSLESKKRPEAEKKS